ncbi:MAG: alpha/beta hydrolase [Candidatus Symbiobacter sp.]|nr:alpha/beta hydrolase [Candidatus Symbiobacter sp.]
MPEIMLSGPEGRLEARYSPSKQTGAPTALVLHPHPLHGGTMNNRVTYALYQTFHQRGFSVLRFNFRGVGRSEGSYDQGEGELADAAAALDWLGAVNGEHTATWVAGFSFGAWIGMQLLMRRPEIAGFIAVSPPANLFDFSFLAPCPVSGLVVHGSEDEIVPLPAVTKLVAKLATQREITVEFQTIAGAGHFYQHHLEELGQKVGHYLDIRALSPTGLHPEHAKIIADPSLLLKATAAS